MRSVLLFKNETEIEALVAKYVDKALADRLNPVQPLPVRMSVKEAARRLGMHPQTFRGRYKHLYRFDGNSSRPFVNGDDLREEIKKVR